MYDKPTANITLKKEILETTPLHLRIRQNCPLSTLLFDVVSAAHHANRSDKERERKQWDTKRKEVKLSPFPDDITDLIIYMRS